MTRIITCLLGTRKYNNDQHYLRALHHEGSLVLRVPLFLFRRLSRAFRFNKMARLPSFSLPSSLFSPSTIVVPPRLCSPTRQDEAHNRIPSHEGRRCRRGRCRWIIAWHRHQGEFGKNYFYVSTADYYMSRERPRHSPTHIFYLDTISLVFLYSHGDYPETWHTSRKSRRLLHHRA